MDNMSHKLILVLISTASLSCAMKEYKLPEDGPVASVSFSNLSLGVPELNIINNCESSFINKNYIESKSPTDKAKYKIKIRSKNKITFEYKYHWFSRNGLIPITQASGLHHSVKEKTSSELRTCTKSVTFVPEENKNYEIYFGIQGNKCSIDVGEVHEIDGTYEKKLLHVTTAKAPKC